MPKRFWFIGSSALALFGCLGTVQVVWAQPPGTADVWNYLAEKYDQNKDGQLTSAEYDRGAEAFARLDRNGDGVLTQSDWIVKRGGPAAANQRGERPGEATAGEAPRVGTPAPDFDLPYVKDATKTVRLSSFAGKKPVALIFGSYT